MQILTELTKSVLILAVTDSQRDYSMYTLFCDSKAGFSCLHVELHVEAPCSQMVLLVLASTHWKNYTWGSQWLHFITWNKERKHDYFGYVICSLIQPDPSTHPCSVGWNAPFNQSLSMRHIWWDHWGNLMEKSWPNSALSPTEAKQVLLTLFSSEHCETWSNRELSIRESKATAGREISDLVAVDVVS